MEEKKQNWYLAEGFHPFVKLAFASMYSFIADGKRLSIDDLPDGVSAALAGVKDELNRPSACFVSLKIDGQLRGCIGTLEPREPLAAAVRSSAISAATQDPRFPPVTADELDDLHIEISVLSPLRKVDSPDEIIVGVHGVMVAHGMRRGVFLPQVAVEQGWDRDTMLNYLCAHKAGLPADAWRHGADLYVFTAQVFGEDE